MMYSIKYSSICCFLSPLFSCLHWLFPKNFYFPIIFFLFFHIFSHFYLIFPKFLIYLWFRGNYYSHLTYFPLFPIYLMKTALQGLEHASHITGCPLLLLYYFGKWYFSTCPINWVFICMWGIFCTLSIFVYFWKILGFLV